MINSISINNYKCFENKKIKLNQLTILAGSNSSGKSSVIQSILLSKITIDKLVQYNTYDNKTLESPIVHVPLNGKYLMSLGNTIEVLSRDVNSNQISFLLSDLSKDTTLYLPFKAEDNEDDFYDLELSDDWIQKGMFDNLKYEFYYLNAERLGPRLSYDADQLDYIHVGWQGEYTIQVLSQLKEKPIEQSEKRKHKDSEDTKLITQARLWMQEIIPDFYLDDAILEGKLKKAHATFSKSSPTNVGFGNSYVLPIVINGLIAKEKSVFIVENPEAHLHPAGQSKIGYFLGKIASSGVQVIIETHSEHVINGVRIASIDGTISASNIIVNFFTKSAEKNSLIKEISIDSKGDLTSYPKGFFDQEQKDIATIIDYKRKTTNN